MLGEFLVELVGEILDETLAVFLPNRAPRERDAKRMHPGLAAIGYLCIGVFVGVMSLLVWRRGLLPHRFDLLMVLAMPVLGGIAALGLGLWLRMHGRRTTSFTTFWGGAGLTLGIACARAVLAL